MGGSPNNGGMWVEQAPAELFSNDAGRPTPLASDVAFIPLQVRPALEGNRGAGLPNVSETPPALLTIRVSKGGRMQVFMLPWRPGVSLKYYLQDAGLIGTRLRTALKIDGQRVRMSHVPKCGDVLNMTPVGRSMS